MDIDVTLTVDVDEAKAPNGLIINEYIPSGWTLVSATPAQNSYDSSTGEIGWLFFGSNVNDRTISYTLLVPSTETIGAKRNLNGELLYNDPDGNPVTVMISGDRKATIGYP